MCFSTIDVLQFLITKRSRFKESDGFVSAAGDRVEFGKGVAERGGAAASR